MGKVVYSPTQTQNQGRARKVRLWVGVPGSSIPEANLQEVDKALAFTRDTLGTSGGNTGWKKQPCLHFAGFPPSPPVPHTAQVSFLPERKLLKHCCFFLGLLHKAMSQLLQEGFLAQAWPLLPAFQGLELATLLLLCRIV